MADKETCHFCGAPIDVGEVWMEADIEWSRAVAHAECVYREEPTAEEHAAWMPGEPGPQPASGA